MATLQRADSVDEAMHAMFASSQEEDSQDSEAGAQAPVKSTAVQSTPTNTTTIILATPTPNAAATDSQETPVEPTPQTSEFMTPVQTAGNAAEDSSQTLVPPTPEDSLQTLVPPTPEDSLATSVPPTPEDSSQTSQPEDSSQTSQPPTQDSSQDSTTAQPPTQDSSQDPSNEEYDVVANLVANDNFAEAVEVDGHDQVAMMEHDEFAVTLIKKTTVHFALRRTKPTLYRHDCTCLSHIRLFRAIDDGVRLACVGVKWELNNKVQTVLVVACLGYAKRNNDNKKSAKVEDLRATHIIMRTEDYDNKPLEFGQMTRTTAVAMFRNATPLGHVDTEQQERCAERVKRFVADLEENQKGSGWLNIVTNTPQPTPKPKPDTATPANGLKNARAAAQSERRKRKRDSDRLNRESKRKQKALAEEQELVTQQQAKVERAAQARRRRATLKTIDSRVTQMNDRIMDKMQEQMEYMKENLEDMVRSAARSAVQQCVAKNRKKIRRKTARTKENQPPATVASAPVPPATVPAATEPAATVPPATVPTTTDPPTTVSPAMIIASRDPHSMSPAMRGAMEVAQTIYNYANTPRSAGSLHSYPPPRISFVPRATSTPRAPPVPYIPIPPRISFVPRAVNTPPRISFVPRAVNAHA